MTGGKRSDGRRIDAAAQKDTDGNVRHEAALHRRVKAGSELLRPVALGIHRNFVASQRLEDKVPVPFKTE